LTKAELCPDEQETNLRNSVSGEEMSFIKLEMEGRHIPEGSNIPSRDKENNNVRK